jgi:phage host-nuclease inhibitor protein Gam
LKAVRSRKVSELNADILEGHQSTALCHIGNISYRLGHPSSPAEIEKQLAQLKVHGDALETFERTRKHLVENNVDLEKSKVTLGPLLRLDSHEEKFVDNPIADAFLTREYRKPFIVPAEKEI